ncbi:MAG TPA: hypothetical protein VLA06_06570 [Woeseiaceae bacterium]|jgi:hypothetical protein|nr:hypothetical protein [Woeseiaceae bacterium]
MRKRYEKQDVPAWQRKLIVLIGAFFGATLLLFVAWAVVLLIDWLRVDECLDRGGRYDYESGTCEYGAPERSP